jgi:o-succinylbenzoate---CoA ligase
MTTGFYFQPGARPVDWESADTLVLANPEWTRREGVVLAEVERQLPRLDGHVWVATSGTSSEVPGRVRWIGLSKQAFLASAQAVNTHLDATAADVWAHALPIFHVGGLGILARAHLSGAGVVAAIEERWDAALFGATVAASGATLTALVPSQIHDLVEAGLESPRSLRGIVVGGARLDPSLYRASRELGWPCLPSYGLTETCSQVATASLESLSAESYPAAVPILCHAEIRTSDEGRLSIRAASLLTCCVELSEDGARAWDPKREGWLETEDLGRVDAGAVEVLGRVSESVKVLGELVSLPKVEEQAWRWAAQEGMRALPWFDLAVVAPPHTRRGHELVLVIAGPMLPAERRAEIESSLAAFCREALLPFERIQRVAWVDAIPRTPLGKVQRQLLGRYCSGLEP